MKLSTKARYAITAMMDLALHENSKPVTLADISDYQGISLSYLEQLFAKLRKHKLVSGVRGPGGGYRLAKPSTELTIAEIVSAINEKPEGVEEKKPEVVHEKSSERVKLDEMWDRLSLRLYNFLNNITLSEFVEKQTEGSSDEDSSYSGGIQSGGNVAA
jgi:Rrf2 family iron-sulfur cluster assembly transcriptional regulator